MRLCDNVRFSQPTAQAFRHIEPALTTPGHGKPHQYTDPGVTPRVTPVLVDSSKKKCVVAEAGRPEGVRNNSGCVAAGEPPRLRWPWRRSGVGSKLALLGAWLRLAVAAAAALQAWAREAVVVVVRDVADECVARRVDAVALSSGREVVVLVDRAADVAALRPRPGLTAAAQPRFPAEAAAWRSFGGPRSALAKPSFIRWAADAAPRLNLSAVWHVEDDVFYTGKWRDFFDEDYGRADLVALLHRHEDYGGRWNPKAARECAVGRRLCARGGTLLQAAWPALRLSARLI